jgi:hypothetical protein
MPRSSQYLYRYMAGLALPSLYAQVERDFADLEQRREYLQGLVAQQQQLIADLERTFTVPPTDSIALQAQLEKLDEEGVETSQILAEQRGVMSESQKQAFLSDMRAQGGLNRVTKALEENQGLTRAAYDARVELYRQGLISMGVPAAEARAEADRVTAARVGAGDFAAPGISRERQREMSELEETARVLRQRGPEGIRGGQAGEEEITRRVNAQAAEGTGFATEEDAYQAALAALADGVMDLDDFGGNEAALALAQEVYNKARTLGAYRNDERSNFETAMLQARQRYAQLVAQSEQLAAPEGMSREQELARRQAEALGYDFSKPYVRQQKSRYYNNLIRGDELFNAALEASARLEAEDPDRFRTPQGMSSVVTPTNRSQRLARDYIAQRWNAGDRTINFRELENEFGKVLRGDDLQEALSFAYAFYKGLRANIQTPTDAERQMEAQRAAAEAREARIEAANRARAAAEEQAKLLQRMEFERAAATEQAGAATAAAVRESETAMMAPTNAADSLYKRLMIRGMGREDIIQAMNSGYAAMTQPGVSRQTREANLNELGFKAPDIVLLYQAFEPRIREQVRTATPTELAELSQIPAFQRYITPDMQQRAQGLAALDVVVSAIPDEQRREEARQRMPPTVLPGEVPVPGGDVALPPSPPEPDRVDIMLEQQRRQEETLKPALPEPPEPPPVRKTPAAPPEAEAPARQVDPTNPRYEYVPLEGGGYETYFDGQRRADATPGSRAAQAIQRVLEQGAAPAQEPAEEQPPPTIDGDVTRPRITPRDEQPPSGPPVTVTSDQNAATIGAIQGLLQGRDAAPPDETPPTVDETPPTVDETPPPAPMTLTTDEQRIVELLLARQPIGDALRAMKRIGPDGEPRPLTSAERRAIVDKAQAYIAAQGGQ